MPRVETVAEFNEILPAVRDDETIRFVEYDLVVGENETEVLINLVAKHVHTVDVMPKIFIANRRVLLASAFNHETFFYLTRSLRASLERGEYKIVLLLSPDTEIANRRSCEEYLEKGGDEFLLRLASSKLCSVEKTFKKETEAVERMLIEWANSY